VRATARIAAASASGRDRVAATGRLIRRHVCKTPVAEADGTDFWLGEMRLAGRLETAAACRRGSRRAAPSPIAVDAAGSSGHDPDAARSCVNRNPP
jgi:hypothetical protein